MELDIKVYFGPMCTAVLIGWEPAPFPLSPHLGLYTRTQLVSQNRRHLFRDPLARDLQESAKVVLLYVEMLGPQKKFLYSNTLLTVHYWDKILKVPFNFFLLRSESNSFSSFYTYFLWCESTLWLHYYTKELSIFHHLCWTAKRLH